ncbi:MAG: hypothetical protein R3A10_12110 [Caldilineaceae bacterium]
MRSLPATTCNVIAARRRAGQPADVETAALSNPLALNLLHRRPYGVILVDSRRVRYFVVNPTTAQEVMDFDHCRWT